MKEHFLHFGIHVIAQWSSVGMQYKLVMAGA